MKIYTHLHDLFSTYEGFILDLWGVVHNGVSPYPGAIDCLKALRAAGKKVCFLSNAPRRASIVQEQLARYGIDASLYDLVVTSGEDAFEHLTQRPDAWYQNLGNRFYFLGLPKDQHLCDAIPRGQVTDITQAQFILCAGFEKLGQEVPQFKVLLHQAIDLNLPLICVNPDLEVVVGDQRLACAGALAKYYEDHGGYVRYHGKPHASVYKSIFRQMGWHEGAPVLAIGDSLHTDIRGALNFGIDSAFVCSGIHGEELGLIHGEVPQNPEALEDLCYHYGIVPKIILPGLIL